MNPFGLEERHRKILDELLIAPLKKAGYSLWVFGSRARGDHQKFSDLDVLVGGKPSQSLISQVRESLEESSLPIKVDLVLENELAESYRANVLRDRKEIKSFVLQF